jgi:hypothetical protein
MSDEECLHRGVPAGAFSLMMSKQEIDGAAKDVHNILFPSSLKLEIVFVKLELKGTGPVLKAAVDAGNSRCIYTHIHSRAHAHAHAHAHEHAHAHARARARAHAYNVGSIHTAYSACVHGCQYLRGVSVGCDDYADMQVECDSVLRSAR